jgi:sugar phosphate isomerase/epimerase
MNRRETLAALVGMLPAIAWGGADELGARPHTRMGIGNSSYHLRYGLKQAAGGVERFRTPLEFLEHAHQHGAGGIQAPLGMLSKPNADALRRQAELWQMYVEGSIRLPKDAADVERFAAECDSVRRAGGEVARTVMLGGRRYEVFQSAEEFRRFRQESFRSLELAEPVMRRQELRLAVENHKDWQVPELLDILKRISSEHVGVCVDTGNSIALLEEPHEVVEAYAKYAFAVHLKDMAVEEYADGFLLSEVPFGEGMLDLPRVVNTLKQAQPKLRISLEMMTRDPLKVPVLANRYWATFASLPARQLARSLATVRDRGSKQPLPRISSLSVVEQIAKEEANVRKCIAFAAQRLHC